MTSTRSNTNARNFFASRLFLVVLLVITSIMALLYARAYYQDYMVRQEIKELQGDIEKLNTKKLESLKILEYVTSDQFVEETARTDLNMKKSGESVLVVPQNSQSAANTEAVYNFEADDLSPAMKWWYYFTTSGTSQF
jgi:cell division protein FtsL